MIQLYQYEVCPYCCKVKAVLDYKKVPYEKIEVNPMNHEELTSVPGAIEHDKVPVLVDDGKPVFESNDIVRYLDEKYPQKPVFSKAKKNAQDEWIKFADDELVQILPANIYRNLKESLSSFQYITKVGKFSAWKKTMIALGGAVAMTIVAKKGMKKKGITDPRQSLKETLQKIQNEIAKKKFIGGDSPDVSDLMCYGILSSVRQMKVWDFIKKEASGVAQWYERVSEACH